MTPIVGAHIADVRDGHINCECGGLLAETDDEQIWCLRCETEPLRMPPRQLATNRKAQQARVHYYQVKALRLGQQA